MWSEGVIDRGLTIVPCIDSSKEFDILFHEVCKFVHQNSAVRCGQKLPCWTLEGNFGSFDCNIHVLRTCGLHCRNFCLVAGTSISSEKRFSVEAFLRCINTRDGGARFRFHKLIVDE